MIKQKTTFDFPNMFDIDTGKTRMLTGLKATNSNIGLLLRTSLFETFGDPGTGSRLAEYLFSPNSEMIKDLILDHLKSVLEQKQPDIRVIYIDLYSYDNDEGTVHIRLDYQDLTTGQICQNSVNINYDDFRDKEGNIDWQRVQV